MLQLRSAPTEALSDLELTELRMLLYVAFDGGFDSNDWDHTLGGRHFLGLRDGAIVAHASVVTRELRLADRSLHTGYVEGVAVAEDHRREGYGHRVMAAAGRVPGAPLRARRPLGRHPHPRFLRPARLEAVARADRGVRWRARSSRRPRTMEEC